MALWFIKALLRIVGFSQGWEPAQWEWKKDNRVRDSKGLRDKQVRMDRVMSWGTGKDDGGRGGVEVVTWVRQPVRGGLSSQNDLWECYLLLLNKFIFFFFSNGTCTWLFFFNKFIYLFIYFWLCWVFVSVRGLSLVAASGGHSSSRCAGLSVSRPLLLWSTGSRRAGSVVVAHGPSCSAACGILSDQGSNPCPLHWQADSQLLRHQGSPQVYLFNLYFFPMFIEKLEDAQKYK